MTVLTPPFKPLQLSYNQIRTYLLTLLLIAANIILPHLLHILPITPNGGQIWLPILFFTLIGAYKMGWQVGLATALISPTISYLLVGMPTLSYLPILLVKSLSLAIFAGLIAHRSQKVSLLLLALVIIGYQSIGALVEWMLISDWSLTILHIQTAIPGMLFQLIGGYITLRIISNYE